MEYLIVASGTESLLAKYTNIKVNIFNENDLLDALGRPAMQRVMHSHSLQLIKTASIIDVGHMQLVQICMDLTVKVDCPQ